MEFPCRAFLCACGGRYSPPPHAWGILPYLASRYVRGRFIPTCVGNTSSAYPDSTATAVHPHVRGEYILPRFHRHGDIGSSPRAWGIPLLGELQVQCRRFIPTCVGNTLPLEAGWSRQSVHPHVRGEYLNRASMARADHGSSPRAWGIRAERKATCPWSAVHPHVRGEYGCHGRTTFPPPGSSPRAWGIPGLAACCAGVERFIPTCVGNT